MEQRIMPSGTSLGAPLGVNVSSADAPLIFLTMAL